MKPELKFLPNLAGEKEGLGEAGIETFKGSPYSSCAREAGQNSKDAACSSEQPVKITFNILHLDQNKFPSHSKLREVINQCHQDAKQDREKEFFKNALKVINGSKIPVLEIADSNTTGLLGPPNEEDTPFHSLVKGDGVTIKNYNHSGGSFGIGKKASFAVSDLYAVFYSTVYLDKKSEREVFAAQGKVKLVSHKDSERKQYRATGYWGNPSRFTAVTDRTVVPEWMDRKVVGTSIFCMGFREADDWAQRMIYSLVSNFFCAIHRHEMVFEVDDKKFCINKNTLEYFLKKDAIIKAAEEIGHESDLKVANELYRCLVSDKSSEKTIDLPNKLGQVRVRILVEEELSRKVGFIRNGMLITYNLRHFGHPMVRFPGSKDFIVLVEPSNDKTSELLKKLENPAHDDFSSERILDPKERNIIKNSIKKLGDEIRGLIRKTTITKTEGTVVLDELGDFFSTPSHIDDLNNPKSENDPEKYTYTPHKSQPKQNNINSPFGGKKGGSRRSGKKSKGGNGGGHGKGTGGGIGGKGIQGDHETIKLSGVRNLIHNDKDGEPVSRKLFFTPEKEGSIKIFVQASGVNTAEDLRLIDTDRGNTGSNSLTLDVERDERVSLTVTFADPYAGPIELIAISD